MDPKISGASPVNPQSLRELQKAAEAEAIVQIESAADLEQWGEEAFNPLAMMRRFRPLQDHRDTKKQEQKERAEEKKILAIKQIEEVASRFHRNNEELQVKTLAILRSRISAKDNSEEILRKVLEVYSDHALADEALDFLIETADATTLEMTRLAKELLNQRFERDIKAGRNMGAQARTFSKEGLGSPTTLRDMYRDITGTPREPLKLFEELSDKYPYNKLRTTIHFLLHSLGADLRSKGSSIPRAELKRLIDETRSLQGILGIYRFFQGRMRLIQRQFESYQIAMPPRIGFDSIARLFVKFLAERFISPDKIMQAARLLGISEELAAQIIIFTQMRDALKQIAPRYYRNDQHRDELFKAFLKALEDLEDKFEEEEEKDQEKKKKKKKKI